MAKSGNAADADAVASAAEMLLKGFEDEAVELLFESLEDPFPAAKKPKHMPVAPAVAKPPAAKAPEQPAASKAIEQPAASKAVEQPAAVKAVEQPPAAKAIKQPPPAKAGEQPPAAKAAENPPPAKAGEQPPGVKAAEGLPAAGIPQLVPEDRTPEKIRLAVQKGTSPLMKMMGTPEEDLFAALGRKHPGLMGNWKRLPYPMEKKPTCSFCEKQFLDQPHAKPTEEHTLRMGAGGSMCVFCVNGGRAATWHQRQAEWTEEQRVQALAASEKRRMKWLSKFE